MSPDDIPDWVARLGAAPSNTTPAEWSRWRAEVTTYSVTFDAMFPKRSAQERRDNWSEDYGKVILRSRAAGDRSVPEIEVVEGSRASGWDAVWLDTFGKTPGWMKPWTRGRIPPNVADALKLVRAASPEARPWDVLAWRGAEVRFVECKGVTEGFTRGEQAFIWGAPRVGLTLEGFAVVRGAILYPERPSA